jgi:hypothetical protein
VETAKWNDWLTLLANFGVVIGLGMLIFELKHSSDLAEVGAYQTRMTEISETSKNFALSEDMADIYERLRSDGLAALEPAEVRRVQAWELGKMIRMQAQFYQFQRGFLDEVSANAMLRAAAVNLSVWDELGLFPDDVAFRQAVEAVEMPKQRSAMPY